MYLEYIYIALMISIIIFIIIYGKESKRNESKKQVKALDSIKENLKNIKNEFDNHGEYNYNIKSSMLIIYLAFVISCGLSTYLGYCLFSEGSYKLDDIKGFAMSVLLVFLTLLLIILKNTIKNIKLDNSKMTIYSGKKTMEYNIQEIEKLNIETITTHNSKFAITKNTPFLNIKSKNNNKQDSYEIKYNSLNNVTAILIYINLIKQNNASKIDALTDEEIQNLVDEILIKGAI